MLKNLFRKKYKYFVCILHHADLAKVCNEQSDFNSEFVQIVSKGKMDEKKILHVLFRYRV